MENAGTRTAILSFSLIGLVDDKASIAVAREFNEYAATIRDSDPLHFGFFATIPSLLEPEAALEEIRFAFDELYADGILLMTHYGDSYLGNHSFIPIWSELDSRNAVVLVHPYESANPAIINKLLQPSVLDFPYETTKTAMDMIVNGTMRSFPHCSDSCVYGGLPSIYY
jgi:6-methylsalicylate decarboxylase